MAFQPPIYSISSILRRPPRPQIHLTSMTFTILVLSHVRSIYIYIYTPMVFQIINLVVWVIFTVDDVRNIGGVGGLGGLHSIDDIGNIADIKETGGWSGMRFKDHQDHQYCQGHQYRHDR